MKTLKTIIINLFYTTIFVLIITSCHTKHLNKQMARTTDRQTQESTIIRNQNEWHQGGQIISMSDSGNHQYRINIFPLDTFSFSLQNGFKGKASMIEVVGTRQEVKKVTDSSAFRAERQEEIQYDSKSKSWETTASGYKKLEKKKSTLLLNILVLGVSVLVIRICWRLWKQRIGR